MWNPEIDQPSLEVAACMQSVAEVEERAPRFMRLRRAGMAIAAVGLSLSTISTAEALNDGAPDVVETIPYFGGDTHLECGPVATSHRGMAGGGENTIPAIEKGLRTGADAVEIDVRKTRDGKMVLLHDQNVSRTTNGRGLIKNMIYERARKLRTNNGSHIPLLKRALWKVAEFGSNDRRVQLDLKVALSEADATQVLRWVDKFGLRERITFAATRTGRLAKFNRLANDIPGGYIQPNGRWPNLDNVPGYVDTINVVHTVGTKARIAQAARKGFGVLVRSVNTKRAAERAIKNNAAIINSDNPAAVVDACK